MPVPIYNRTIQTSEHTGRYSVITSQRAAQPVTQLGRHHLDFWLNLYGRQLNPRHELLPARIAEKCLPGFRRRSSGKRSVKQI
jgi:hypothetical protein